MINKDALVNMGKHSVELSKVMAQISKLKAEKLKLEFEIGKILFSQKDNMESEYCKEIEKMLQTITDLKESLDGASPIEKAKIHAQIKVNDAKLIKAYSDFGKDQISIQNEDHARYPEVERYRTIEEELHTLSLKNDELKQKIASSPKQVKRIAIVAVLALILGIVSVLSGPSHLAASSYSECKSICKEEYGSKGDSYKECRKECKAEFKSSSSSKSSSKGSKSTLSNQLSRPQCLENCRSGLEFCSKKESAKEKKACTEANSIREKKCYAGCPAR